MDVLGMDSDDWRSLQNLLPGRLLKYINHIDENGLHPLFHAVKSGQPELVVAVLNHPDVQVNLETSQGSALDWVCQELSKHPRFTGQFFEDSQTARFSVIMMALLLSGATRRKPKKPGPEEKLKGQAAQVFADYTTSTIAQVLKKYPLLKNLKKKISGTLSIHFYDGAAELIPYEPDAKIHPFISQICQSRGIGLNGLLIKDQTGKQIYITGETPMAGLCGSEIYITLLKSSERIEMERIFQNDADYKRLLEYASDRQITENIQFLKEVFEFKLLMKEKSESIYNRFIKDQSDDQINITHNLANAIEGQLNSNTFSSNQFDEAHQYVLLLVKLDLYNFLHLEKEKIHISSPDRERIKISPPVERHKEPKEKDKEKDTKARLSFGRSRESTPKSTPVQRRSSRLPSSSPSKSKKDKKKTQPMRASDANVDFRPSDIRPVKSTGNLGDFFRTIQ